MKKIKLEIDEEIEFPILGLSTALADYRLAWELNSKLNLSFRKLDGTTFFSIPDKNKKDIDYEYYSYVNEEEMSKFFLVKNKQRGSTLFNDRERLDFFLVLRDNFIYEIEDLISDLRKIEGFIAFFSFLSSEF
ncbi:MAG: IPExxxVDY family protein [Crocinitomicaceae bacterium]